MSSISQIKVPGLDGPLHITTQQEVELHLSEALALHFWLTAHSPFLVDPLWFELGLLGTSPATQAILQGTYQCPQQELTPTHSSSLLFYGFLQGSSLSPQVSAMMILSDIGDAPRNGLHHPTLGSTMATTRQVLIAPGLQSSMH